MPDEGPIDPFSADRGPALAVETYVREESGRWVVEIVVVFTDEAVHRRVNDYPTRRQAEIAASWMKRAADRDTQPRQASRETEGPIDG